MIIDALFFHLKNEGDRRVGAGRGMVRRTGVHRVGIQNFS